MVEIMKRPTKEATKTEKENWAKYLKNETHEQKIKRVIEPRIKKTGKLIDNLTKVVSSPNYVFNDDQKQKMLGYLKKKLEKLENSVDDTKQEEQVDIF